jgi:hypothetical protein
MDRIAMITMSMREIDRLKAIQTVAEGSADAMACR